MNLAWHICSRDIFYILGCCFSFLLYENDEGDDVSHSLIVATAVSRDALCFLHFFLSIVCNQNRREKKIEKRRKKRPRRN
jgi:hypothetical protein